MKRMKSTVRKIMAAALILACLSGYAGSAQAARQQILPHWLEVPSYEQAYALLLAGRGVFLSPMQYASFPPEWCLPLELAEPFPDTCLFSLKNERRPQVHALIRLICETYREQFGPV